MRRSVVKWPRRDRLRPRSTSWLAWGLWPLVVLGEGLLIGFLLANDGLSTRELIVGVAFWVPFLAFATVGAVVFARRPGNRIGWLCRAIGLVLGLYLTALLLTRADRSWCPRQPREPARG